jgi:TolA-binding protein
MKNNGEITRKQRIRPIAAAVLICALAMTLSACAYFNTYYNANRIFNEAEAERGEGGGRIAGDKYADVVERCSKIVRDHPDSRWVDDALFLMGKALIRQEEYSSGIRKFTEIITNYPGSNYVPESYYWLAYANYLKRDYNAADVYIKRFTELYPEEDVRFEVYSLGGDVSLMLERREEALAFYSIVADESPDRDMRDQAILRSAELFYDQEEWEEAASYYERALRKGLTKEMRLQISVPLGECYARTGRCTEALELFDELLAEITLVKDKPDLLLGRAESYVCMDSLLTAIEVYRSITKQFPKSLYSAKAYYHIGLIYHESLDSLQKAQEAYSMVSKESPSSEYAAEGLQRSNSLKNLLELQASAGGEQTREQAAEKRFLSAEIQLTRLNEIELAIDNYSAVVDSFPETTIAPKAAYALAWIYERKRYDRERAVEMYQHIIWSYPKSYQAEGALVRLMNLGEEDRLDLMQAYVDSALADTTGLAAELAMQAADSAAVDTTGIVMVPPTDSAVVAPVAAADSVAPGPVNVAAESLWRLIDNAWEEAARQHLQLPVRRMPEPVPADTARADTTTSIAKPVHQETGTIPAGADSTKQEGNR